MPRNSADQRKTRIEQLRRNAALNYEMAADLITNGADEEFVQELRDRAGNWMAEAYALELGISRRSISVAPPTSVIITHPIAGYEPGDELPITFR